MNVLPQPTGFNGLNIPNKLVPGVVTPECTAVGIGDIHSLTNEEEGAEEVVVGKECGVLPSIPWLNMAKYSPWEC